MTQDKFHLRTAVIVQTRMGSSRLPGKAMKKILGRPLLSFLLERLRTIRCQDEIIVATTNHPADQIIEDFCNDENVSCMRGDEADVLDRYFQAAHAAKADAVVRVTGDCPLIDPLIADKVIRYFLDHYPKYDYVSNVIERTYPRGLDIEVFSIKCLDILKKSAATPEEKEHVTLHLLNHKDQFSTHSIVNDCDLSDHRWTVDTPEDLSLVQKIIEALYPILPQFTMNDILQLLDKHPDWKAINAHIKQKKI